MPGKHSQELEVNKQVNDKERVAAAMENRDLMNLVYEKIMTEEERMEMNQIGGRAFR